MNNKQSLIIRKEREHFKFGISSSAYNTNLVISHGKGIYLYDAAGKEYIDLFAGPGIVALGHSHPKFIKGLKEQLDQFIVGSYTTKTRSEYVTQLFKLLPKQLSQISFFSAGTEANEAAIKLAKCYTGKKQIVSFWGGYHGKTLGSLALSDVNYADESAAMLPGIIRVPYPESSKKIVECSDEEYLNWMVEFIKKAVNQNSTEGLAAIIAEPIQGTAGNIVPIKGFLRALRSLADSLGALLIVDEIITGFGRTGVEFSISEEGIVPDILVVGKGMSNGIPISAVITSEKISSKPPLSKPSALSSSFGGNPLSIKAAQLSLDIIKDEKLVDNSRIVGEFWLENLKDELLEYPFVGDIRGKGLLIGIELVEDKKSMKPLSSNYTSLLHELSLKNNLIGNFKSSQIRINPPLVISKNQAFEATKRIKKCFDGLLKEYKN